MTKHLDSNSSLLGSRVGKLLVLSRVSSKNNNDRYFCACSCGNFRIMFGSVLRSNYNCSCGCVKLTAGGDRKRQTRLYQIWAGMLSRCNNSHREKYKNYGGRGIKVEFDNYLDFKDWALTNGYSDTLTIERIDVNGNYNRLNCTWILAKDQAKNRTNTRR